MKTNEIFVHILTKYFSGNEITPSAKKMEPLELIDELRILWAVLANRIIVVRIKDKNYQLSMSFAEISRGLGKFFFFHKKKYIRPEFFIQGRDCTLQYSEDEEMAGSADYLYGSCDVTGIYDVESPPFCSRFGFVPYVWIDFKTGDCRYFAKRIRKGKIASVVNQITMEEYDGYVEKVAATLNRPARRRNGGTQKKKTAEKK